MSLLFSLLNKYVVERVVLCVDRCGWHDNDYVFPDGSTVGQKDIVLQVARPVVAALYKPSGTLDDWKKEIASVAVGNDLMLTSMCCSFAGPLLKIMAVSRFGVHFHGPSSFGKTKSLLASTASIFRSGDEAKLLKWRGTDNGLEAEAARHNDGPLPIDETGQAEPRALDASIMMLGNGSGKSRADSRGEARQPKLFENVVISSGEQTIEGALAKGGIRSRAGHDVRLSTSTSMSDSSTRCGSSCTGGLRATRSPTKYTKRRSGSSVRRDESSSVRSLPTFPPLGAKSCGCA
jgi:putative DNA primase/helicase